MKPNSEQLLLQLALELAAAKDPLVAVDSLGRFLQTRCVPALERHDELAKMKVGFAPEEIFKVEGKHWHVLLDLTAPIVFTLEGCKGEPLTDFEIGTIHQLVRFFREKVEMVAELKGLTYMDDLTGLYNQRYLEVVLDRELSLAKRSNTPFSVLFLDLDYFKKVNDSHGHIIGSRLLYEVGQEIKKTLRESDITFRYGGDEFVMILSQSGMKDAMLVAERVRTQIEKKRFLAREGLDIRLTATIGVASVPEHAVTKRQILAAADQALYGTKRTSMRNQVSAANTQLQENAANSDE